MRKFRQALASPHSGFNTHDPAATVTVCGHQAPPGDTMNRASLLVAAVLFAVFTAACASGASVGQLKTNPGRYVDKEVTVHGTVTSSWGIPLVPLKMYQVDDGTGEILVVSDENRLPSKGARVKVTGKVSEFAVLGGRSIGLHLRERDLDYDRR
jgi:high-affinity K+ transport system ATPase subunit B